MLRILETYSGSTAVAEEGCASDEVVCSPRPWIRPTGRNGDRHRSS